MIGSLRGTLLERATGEVLIEVAGIGYRVAVSPATAAHVGEVGAEVFLYIHHHIKEDAQTLFGFGHRDERACFETLIGTHGVGPSLALAILSVHAPDALRRAVLDDDVAALCLVPGVGRKTAARLLVELKSRLAELDDDAVAAALAAAGGNGSGPGANGKRAAVDPRAQVREALAGLGYAPDEVRSALAELPAEGDSASLLKHALQFLAGARR